MKNTIKITIAAVMIMLVSAIFISAQEHNHKHKDGAKIEKTKMMNINTIDKNKDGYIYQCPMKCEVPKDKAGECSECGMDLKKVSVKKVKEELMNKMKKHNHKVELNKLDKNNDGYVYECPMKCEVPKDKAGECSKCGMDLKKIIIR